jgi:hypothetical protein
VFFSCYMASVLRVLLEFLRRLCFPTNYTEGCSGHWVSFLAFICRKLGLGRLWRKKPSTFRKTRSAEPSFPCEGAKGYSVLGTSADFREHVVASAVPTSASLMSLHERTPRQTTTATPPGAISPTDPATGSVTADHALPEDEPRSRSPSPTNRFPPRLEIDPTNLPSHVVGVNPASSASYTHESDEILSRPIEYRSHRRQASDSAVPTSASLTSLHERAPRQTTTATPPGAITPTAPATGSVTADHAPPDFDVNRPGNLSSTNLSILSRARDRLSILTQPRELMGSRLGQPSRLPRAIYRQFGLGPKLPPSRSVPVPADILEDAPLSPTTSSVISDFYLPEGRFIHLIHSGQLSRYSKNIKMQVNYTVLL